MFKTNLFDYIRSIIKSRKKMYNRKCKTPSICLLCMEKKKRKKKQLDLIKQGEFLKQDK